MRNLFEFLAVHFEDLSFQLTHHAVINAHTGNLRFNCFCNRIVNFTLTILTGMTIEAITDTSPYIINRAGDISERFDITDCCKGTKNSRGIFLRSIKLIGRICSSGKRCFHSDIEEILTENTTSNTITHNSKQIDRINPCAFLHNMCHRIICGIQHSVVDCTDLSILVR